MKDVIYLIKYETDSRKVKPGQTFVAIKGYTVDGHNYIESAIKNGASEIIAEKKVEKAVPVTKATTRPDAKFHMVTIITRQSKFDELKAAMNDISVTGMTVTNVLGCGQQHGNVQKYRGVEMDMTLLPKIKVDIVVSEVPVDLVITAAKEVLYTGNIGDGKIFVYDVQNVVKVRTGEEGYEALQD